jgi:hypothetical protein
MKHILIFEPETGGHQMEHVRRLLNGILARGLDARVTLLTSAKPAGHAPGWRD